jgi:hypothetical protein
MGSSESFLEHRDKMRTYYEFLRSGSSGAEPFVKGSDIYLYQNVMTDEVKRYFFVKGSDIYLYQNPIFFQKRQQSERVLHQKSVIP